MAKFLKKSGYDHSSHEFNLGYQIKDKITLQVYGHSVRNDIVLVSKNNFNVGGSLMYRWEDCQKKFFKVN